MKKFFACLLALSMLLSLTACGGSGNDATEPAVSVEGTMEELANKIIEKRPVEFMGGLLPVDLTDTSEDGLAALYYNTGLSSAEKISDVAVYEPMMGSMAFSMVLVRANDGESTKALAEEMKSNIDPRKWICVEADDLLVAGFADVVMLIMVSSDSGMTAQSFVDAFAEVCGLDPEFTI